MSTLTFVFSVDESNLILAALKKQPYEIVEPLIAKIFAQAKDQLTKAEVSKAIDEILAEPEKE